MNHLHHEMIVLHVVLKMVKKTSILLAKKNLIWSEAHYYILVSLGWNSSHWITIILTAKVWAYVTLWKYLCYLEVGDKSVFVVAMENTAYKDRSFVLKYPDVWYSREEARRGQETRRMFMNDTRRKKLAKNGIIGRLNLSCSFINSTFIFFTEVFKWYNERIK